MLSWAFFNLLSIAASAVKNCTYNFLKKFWLKSRRVAFRDSVQGVTSLGSHFACLCRESDFHEVKKNITIFQKEKRNNTFNHFYSEKSSKRARQHKSTAMTSNLP